MSAPALTPLEPAIAERLKRLRAAHDERIVLPHVRTFWLEPGCHELGCPCHTPPAPEVRP